MSTNKPAAPKQTDFDFQAGVSLAELPQGASFGHVEKTAVMLWREGDAFNLTHGRCSHFGAPLAQGLVHGDTVFCPWHHACFSLRTGAVVKAPGLAALDTFRSEVRDGKLYAGEKLPALACAKHPSLSTHAANVSIVGSGSAAMGAIAELQQLGYAGAIHIFAEENTLPYDRVKLSKGFLSGNMPAEKVAVPQDFIGRAETVHWHLNNAVVSIDAKARKLRLQDGKVHAYDKLLLCTGAEPRRLPQAGSNAKHVFVLRSLNDAQKFVAALQPDKKVLIVGASFIGLEAAGALRQRGIQVDVVAPKGLPMQNVFGEAVGQLVDEVHRAHGVTFHRGAQLQSIGADHVILDNKKKIAADVVLVAIGVSPRVALAQSAGLACDNGILVDMQLQTDNPHIFAAGDVARMNHGPQQDRIEHWAHAQQMGRIAARNMVGFKSAFAAVPFFWTEHYDVKIRYVGHASKIERAQVHGDLAQRKAAVALWQNGRIAAVLSIGRDDVSMACEAAMQDNRWADLPALLGA